MWSSEGGGEACVPRPKLHLKLSGMVSVISVSVNDVRAENSLVMVNGIISHNSGVQPTARQPDTHQSKTLHAAPMARLLT